MTLKMIFFLERIKTFHGMAGSIYLSKRTDVAHLVASLVNLTIFKGTTIGKQDNRSRIT